MAVEKMQFSMPMAGNEGFPFTVTQGEKEKKEAISTAEAAILKAKAEPEKEAAILNAKAETEKEEGIIEAYYDPEEDDVPYEKLSDGDEISEVDQDAFMARMEARWNAFIKEQEARFPAIGYREYAIGEYSVNDSSDSDDEQECYLRKLEASHGVEGCDIAALVI